MNQQKNTIRIPLDMCDRLGIDEWSVVKVENKKAIAYLLKETDKLINIVSGSLNSPISRQIYLQNFKEQLLKALQ